jgi:nitroreductase
MEHKLLADIFNRKSIRKYTSEKVSKEQLETLVKAGMSAPSALNIQPWAFVAIDERSILDTLSRRLPYAKMLSQAQAAIVVCGDLGRADDDWQRDYWIQDCSAASENILLAATAMGLGSVWTAVYADLERIATVKEILKLPDHIIPLNVIPLGYPDGEFKPMDKWKPENLHWQCW